MKDRCRETVLAVLKLLESNQHTRVFRELQNTDHCNNPKLHEVRDKYKSFLSQTPNGDKTLENIQNYKTTDKDVEKIKQLSQYTEWTKQHLISSLSGLERLDYLLSIKPALSMVGKIIIGVFIFRGTVGLFRSFTSIRKRPRTNTK